MMEPSKDKDRYTDGPQPRRVAVKFRDEFIQEGKYPYKEGVEAAFPPVWREQWAVLRKEVLGAAEVTLKPVFTSVLPERIQELEKSAAAMDPTYRPPNFLSFYVIDVPSEQVGDDLVKRLSQWEEIVEYAYLESIPSLPSLTTTQEYISASAASTAPKLGGINAEYAWTQLGVFGKDTTFMDIESGWCLIHPDLKNLANNQLKISPPLRGTYNEGRYTDPVSHVIDCSASQHGTSVLGILSANPNALHHPDWHGLAPESTGMVASIWTDPAPNPPCNQQTGIAANPIGSYTSGAANIANAIMVAADQLTFGDVALLELQLEKPEHSKSYWPVESQDHNFSVIRLATALGITVIEAAGNGNNKIDLENGKDSGAVIVGAASPANAASYVIGAKTPDSNYGSKVKCFAWGNKVYSLDVDKNTGQPILAAPAGTQYTNSFGGTSAAAAIIAGAALLVQSFVQKRFSQPGRRFRLNAFQMRDRLSDPATGTLPRAAPAITGAANIGVMPDLKKIFEKLLITQMADLVVRDHLNDNGDPHNFDLFASPDVIVRKFGSVLNPRMEFGSTTAVMNAALSRDIRKIDGDQEIYVRVSNRGGATAFMVRPTVYWSKPADLCFPDRWTRINSSTSPASVTVPAPNAGVIVLNRVVWPAAQIPPVGEYCFIVTVTCTTDPDPLSGLGNLSHSFADINDFNHLIRSNNNITTKNFRVLA